jgi:hypothetical protein
MRRRTPAPLHRTLCLTGAWLGCLILSALPLTGQNDGEDEEPIPRPGAGIVPLRATVIEEQIDGMIARETEVTGGGVRFRMPAFGGWYVQADNRYSLRMSNRSRPSIYMTFTLFQEEAFLPELSPDAIDRHVLHLEETLGPRFVLLNPDTDYAIEEAPTRPLNERGLLLEYRILPSDPEQASAEIHRVTFVAMPGGLLLELRLVAPEPFFAPITREYGMYLRSMYLVE